MADWDEEKLEDVVNKKHGESNKKKMETKIVSVQTLIISNSLLWIWAKMVKQENQTKLAMTALIEIF